MHAKITKNGQQDNSFSLVKYSTPCCYSYSPFVIIQNFLAHITNLYCQHLKKEYNDVILDD